MSTIQDIKNKFKNEWVLVEVTENDELNQPTKGKVIAHSKNREDTYNAMTKTKATDIAHLYTGEIPKKGYAAAFRMQ